MNIELSDGSKTSIALAALKDMTALRAQGLSRQEIAEIIYQPEKDKPREERPRKEKLRKEKSHKGRSRREETREVRKVIASSIRFLDSGIDIVWTPELRDKFERERSPNLPIDQVCLNTFWKTEYERLSNREVVVHIFMNTLLSQWSRSDAEATAKDKQVALTHDVEDDAVANDKQVPLPHDVKDKAVANGKQVALRPHMEDRTKDL